jgi:uncharacterized protein (TIGR03437 family)
MVTVSHSRCGRRTRLSPLLFLSVALLSTAPYLLAQNGPPPFVNSANNSADYSTTIAQGSLFVVFGSNLGPATLVEVSSFPLQDALAGTSVTVTVGSTKLSCPMIYTSSAQVAAILPSNTPVGTASVTVSYNGSIDTYGFATTPVTVAASSVGIYSTTSSGLGVGIFTALDGSLKTFANSAKPGEIVTAWGTGIGPIGTSDSVLPTTFPNFPNVQVWVGGQAATIAYDGRSGCCAAVDQISFTVPAVAGGCDVPVTIVSGGVSSNSVTLPVAAAGGACSDTGPTLPTSVLTKAAAGTPVKMGVISIGPSTILGTGTDPRTLAQTLSAALHTTVPEADAARLLRAYRTKNAAAIRTAMTKYASQWKALDAKTKASLLSQIGLAQARLAPESVLAEFGTLSNEATIATVAGAQFPPIGECMDLPNTGLPLGLGAVSAGLDAGSSLLLTGAAGTYTLKQITKGQYQAMLGSSVVGPNIPLGTYTVSGTGGKDVGAFSASVTVASHLAISNKSSLATVDETQPLTVTWTGGIAGNYVLIGGGATSPPHSYFICAEDAGTGTFSVPGYILSTVRATTTASGIIWISANPLSNQLTIPGLDSAVFADASSDSVSVAFSKSTLPAGPNVANVTGSIDGLYPKSTTGPLVASALLTAATFTTAFDVLPGASPFVVQAMSAAGNATININPAQNTWQATYVVPTPAADAGSFSGDGFTVTNYLNGLPFPGNIIPESLLDPAAVSASSLLPLPNVATATGPNGSWTASGTLPAGGHFTIGAGTNPGPNFGGFINLTTRGAQSASFSLYVDGQLVATKQVPFTTD